MSVSLSQIVRAELLVVNEHVPLPIISQSGKSVTAQTMRLGVGRKVSLMAPYHLAGFQRRPKIPERSSNKLVKRLLGRPGLLLLLKTVKRTPSKRTSPSKVVNHR